MGDNLAGVEIVFAQKLASGEPITRKRALTALHEWIQEQSQTRSFKDEDMMRLCKGLHYVMWMQDKMLLQEELADKIAGLLTIFKSEEERTLFVKSLLICLSKEWHKIDRWRMDKFLMLMRRLIRTVFIHLKNCGWKKNIRTPYWNIFKETTISADKSFSEGLKFHFASIFLDELDNAGGLTKKQMTICLSPFAQLLSLKQISDYLFDSFLEEIFMTILHQRSEEIASQMEDGDSAQPNISFSYSALGRLLFDIGKQPQITSERRKKIYDVVKKFELAATGADPLQIEIRKPKMVLKSTDIVQAEEKIAKFAENIKRENLKFKQDMKRAKSKQSHEATEKPAIKRLQDKKLSKITKKPKGGLRRQNAVKKKNKNIKK